MTPSQRKLSEFLGGLICRLVGLTFDERELVKVLRKAGIKLDLGRRPSVAEMHGALAHACTNSDSVSKYVDKLLGERFEPYSKRIEGLDPKAICELIERKSGVKDIPLPALIWFASRNQHQEIREIEARVFNAIHMKEHQALRFYDTLSRMLPDGRAENVLQELEKALKSNEELQRRYKRSEQKKEQLRGEIEAIKKDRSNVALALVEQQQLNETLNKELEKLGGKSAVEQIESLKKEIELLGREIESLTQELLKQGPYRVPDELPERLVCQRDYAEDSPATLGEIDEERDVAPPVTLNGKKVAFVGGIESLVPYYKQIVESLGGVFCDYRRGCPFSKSDVEELVSKADVIFCPVDINSHGACRNVKKVCKLTGKPCCFLRSSGLGMFGRELADFARSAN